MGSSDRCGLSSRLQGGIRFADVVMIVPGQANQHTAGLLHPWGVALFLSPVRRPQYNGSAETGNGSMKIRTEHVAAMARPKAKAKSVG